MIEQRDEAIRENEEYCAVETPVKGWAAYSSAAHRQEAGAATAEVLGREPASEGAAAAWMARLVSSPFPVGMPAGTEMMDWGVETSNHGNSYGPQNGGRRGETLVP